MWKKLAIEAAKEALQDKNACACFIQPNGIRAVCVYHTILEAAHRLTAVSREEPQEDQNEK